MRFELVFLALLAVFCMADDDCMPVVTFPDGSTYTFNLTALHHGAGASDVLSAYDDSYNTYYFNLCGTVTTASTGNCQGASVCQQSAGGDYNNAGSYSSQQFMAGNGTEPGQGLIVKYTDGTKCSNGDVRQTTITLVCDPTLDPLIDMVKEVSHCSYSISVKTVYACGSKGGAGAGDTVALVILLILIFGFILYFVIGAIYQKKVKDAANLREMIIHNEFWCSLPSLVKDGCLFIGHCFKRGDYVSV